jgi:predicted lipoprotein with Yx(FWY)xxD motif
MKTITFLFFTVLLILPGVAIANHHAIKIAHKEGVGSYLTDAEGNTLYWFKKDSPNQSVCAGPCVEKWPIYYREKVASPEGISDSDFATINRSDGKPQTTFRGYPLYYWFKDAKPGDTSGQGVGNVWYVIDPVNFPPK